jgi:hypothetical protein
MVGIRVPGVFTVAMNPSSGGIGGEATWFGVVYHLLWLRYLMTAMGGDCFGIYGSAAASTDTVSWDCRWCVNVCKTLLPTYLTYLGR